MKYHILFVLLSIILFTGCNKADHSTLTQMPSPEEYNEFYRTHTPEEFEKKLLQIKELIDQTSLEEANELLQTALEDWRKKQTILPVDEVQLTLTEDSLLINEWTNEKIYKNYSADVRLYYDSAQISDNEESLVTQLQDAAINALLDNLYGKFKVRAVTVSCFDSDTKIGRFGIQTVNSGGDSINKETIWTVSRPQEELHTQTIVTQFIETYNRQYFDDPKYMFARHNNVTLKHFGIEHSEQALYMEIPVYSPPMDVDLSEYKRSLDDKSEELSNLLLSDETSLKYLQENQLQFVKIEFTTPWDKENRVYVFDIK